MLYDGHGNSISIEQNIKTQSVMRYINVPFAENYRGGYRIDKTTGTLKSGGSEARGVLAFDVSKYQDKIILNAVGVSSSALPYYAFFDCATVSDCSTDTLVGEMVDVTSGVDTEISIPAGAKLLTLTGHYHDTKKIVIATEQAKEVILENDTLPDYAKQNIEEQVAKANDLVKRNSISNPNNVDQFIFFTDYHYNPLPVLTDTDNAKNSAAAMRYVLNHTGVGKILFGGDIENANVGTQEEFYACLSDFDEYFGSLRKNMFCVIGNHEHNCTDRLTTAQLCQFINKYVDHRFGEISNRGDFYFDVSAKKIRYVGLMASNKWSEHTDSIIADESIEWFASLMETVPAGYTVVIFTHLLAEMRTTADGSFDGYYSSGDKHDSVEIINCIDAVMNRGMYKTHDYSSANFVVACVMTGHWHYDGAYTTNTGVPIIVTTADSCRRRRIRYDVETKEWVYGREDGDNLVGTADEQAFDVVTLDTANRKIYCTRVGYGYDREFSF